MADYDDIVQSALDTIPECRQLEDLYPNTIHFITHYGMHGNQLMNSQVWLDNAMTITVQYEITVDYKAKKITDYKNPIFTVKQYRSINEFKEARYEGIIGEMNFISASQWDAFIGNAGDVTFLGNYNKVQDIEHWDAFVEAWMRNKLGS